LATGAERSQALHLAGPAGPARHRAASLDRRLGPAAEAVRAAAAGPETEEATDPQAATTDHEEEGQARARTVRRTHSGPRDLSRALFPLRAALAAAGGVDHRHLRGVPAGRVGRRPRGRAAHVPRAPLPPADVRGGGGRAGRGRVPRPGARRAGAALDAAD